MFFFRTQRLEADTGANGAEQMEQGAQTEQEQPRTLDDLFKTNPDYQREFVITYNAISACFYSIDPVR